MFYTFISRIYLDSNWDPPIPHRVLLTIKLLRRSCPIWNFGVFSSGFYPRDLSWSLHTHIYTHLLPAGILLSIPSEILLRIFVELFYILIDAFLPLVDGEYLVYDFKIVLELVEEELVFSFSIGI